MVPWLNNSGQGPWSPKIGQYFQNLGPTYCKLPLCSWCGDAVGTQWVGQWPTLKRIRGRFGRVPECDSSAWAELIAQTKGPPDSFVHTSQWVGEFAPWPWYFCRVQTNREAKSHAGRRQWTLHTIVKKCNKKCWRRVYRWVCEAGTASYFLPYIVLSYCRSDILHPWEWYPMAILIGNKWWSTGFWDNPIGFRNPRNPRSGHDPGHHVTTGCSRCLRWQGEGMGYGMIWV